MTELAPNIDLNVSHKGLTGRETIIERIDAGDGWRRQR